MTQQLTTPTTILPVAGIFARWRTRWLGERDTVETQLADIARQGARMAQVAHVCASALLILFSAASFVALGGDTFAEIQARWSASRELNVAAAISLSVITLMVLAFDVGMLYAASMLRLLATRRAGLGEQWLHVLVMVSVAAIEAATYMYMAWRYEHPATALAWALIAVRAAAAPLLAVYLSMARPLPVTARDILAQAELASGAGVIRDVVREAQDQGAPLAHKIALYGASAVMRPDDRERLHAMLGVVQVQTPAAGVTITPEEVPTPPEPPAGRRPRALKQGSRKSTGRVLELAPPERRLRALLEAEPGLSVRALAKRAHTSQATASKHRAVWRAEAAPGAEAAQ